MGPVLSSEITKASEIMARPTIHIPKRIQRKRVKGWRMPDSTINCTRGSKYGNPFRVGERYSPADVFLPEWLRPKKDGLTAPLSVEDAIDLYKIALWRGELPYSAEEARRELRQYEYVACWCKEDARCHADVLIGVAGACDWHDCRYHWTTFVVTFTDADTGALLSEQVICDWCWDGWMGTIQRHFMGEIEELQI